MTTGNQEDLARLTQLRTELAQRVEQFASDIARDAEALQEAALEVANASTLAELESAIANAGYALESFAAKSESRQTGAYRPSAFEQHGPLIKSSIDNLARVHLKLHNTGTELPAEGGAS